MSARRMLRALLGVSSSLVSALSTASAATNVKAAKWCRNANSELIRLLADDQQHDSGDDHGDARPARDDRRLLLGDRKLERPELALVGFLRVLEVAIEQSE